MFFMMGVMPQTKQLDCDQMVVCDGCGSYGRYVVYMTCNVLSIFFIPVFKWGKKYYVQMSCCDTNYALNPEVGKQLEYGNKVEIQKSDLQIIQMTRKSYCPRCGYELDRDFEYCPKCGTKL